MKEMWQSLSDYDGSIQMQIQWGGAWTEAERFLKDKGLDAA